MCCEVCAVGRGVQTDHVQKCTAVGTGLFQLSSCEASGTSVQQDCQQHWVSTQHCLIPSAHVPRRQLSGQPGNKASWSQSAISDGWCIAP